MIRYFLLANLYAFLFYGLYLVLLKGRTSHAWSRFYLLSATLLSIVLPWIRPDLSGWQQAGPVPGLPAISLPEIVLNPGSGSFSAHLPVAMMILYIAGVCFFLGRFVYRMCSLHLFLKKQQFIKQENYRLALNTGAGPASFGSVIIFPGTATDHYILEHEKAHLQFRHHYDKLVMQLVDCFFFPVAALYFINRELAIVHEFEADEAAAEDRQKYACTLLAEHLGTQQVQLLQSFFHHPLKRRIMMLQRSKQRKNTAAKVLLFLSVIALCSTIVFAQGKSGKEKVSATQQQSNYKSQEKVFSVVDKVPEYPGGIPVLMTYLAEHIHYPEALRKQGKEGKEIVKFVVDKTGKIKNIEIQRSLHPDCDKEVLSALAAMPDWIPGEKDGQKVNVYFTLPVSFKLEDDKPKEQQK